MNEEKCCRMPAPKDWAETCKEMEQVVSSYYEAMEVEIKSETNPLRYLEMKAIIGALTYIGDRFHDLTR
jgi:hypothetical protein